MRVLLLGSTGVLGRAVYSALAPRHEVVGASRNGAEVRADLGDQASLAAMLERVLPLDAVISTAGEAAFGPLAAMTEEALVAGIRSKLLGQIALARLALERLRDGGSVTLTSGVLNHRPIRGSTCAAAVNGALEGFVRAAALEAPRGMRINVVSPTVLEESWTAYAAYFPGFVPVAGAKVAKAYVESVEGTCTGQVFTIY